MLFTTLIDDVQVLIDPEHKSPVFTLSTPDLGVLQNSLGRWWRWRGLPGDLDGCSLKLNSILELQGVIEWAQERACTLRDIPDEIAAIREPELVPNDALCRCLNHLTDQRWVVGDAGSGSPSSYESLYKPREISGPYIQDLSFQGGDFVLTREVYRFTIWYRGPEDPQHRKITSMHDPLLSIYKALGLGPYSGDEPLIRTWH